MSHIRVRYPVFACLFAVLLLTANLGAQETTGGLQGTVSDPTAAVVVGADVVLVGTSMVGTKSLKTDQSGYYHFTNLPPGQYTLTVTAKGFKEFKREGLLIEIGHLPTVNLTLELGSTSSVVEVVGAAPVIDVTTEHTLTNVTSDVIKDIPHGYSFQSVIQFAPGARNEPLAGGMVGPNATGGTGTGGQSAGSGTNGGAFGFSIAGGADSENAYLVEGQETADAIGGFSHTNVPFSFIQEMQVKSTGVEAEYGGALGGVVNVVMQKGTNRFHGSVFSQFESGDWDASPNEYPRYDPAFVAGATIGGALADATYQSYQPKKDSIIDIFPGLTFGGPILKDKLFFFVSFNPEFHDIKRVVNWNWPGNSLFPADVGPTPFTNNTDTYYTNARLDAALTQKIRVFGSWLYQYQKQTGEFMPAADSTSGLLNATATSPPEIYGHNLYFTAPNTTTNVGADITLSTNFVATFRWGYNFQNYGDHGMPTGGAFDQFYGNGVGALDNTGVPIPANSQLSQIAGYISAPNNVNNTTYDATHRNQIDAAVGWYKSGWGGTHNFKFGYQLMRLSNAVEQHYNEPNVSVFPGAGEDVPDYTGPAIYGQNCASEIAIYGTCTGRYGYINIVDYGSLGTATSMNHSFFAQDAWTIGHGLTINAGLRWEHEYLPAEDQPAGGISKPIEFGWGDKIGPRLGAAWDPSRSGKWKIFGSYGKFFDVMKLNLAISSFGGQYWNNCYYTLDTQDLSSIIPAFNNSGRYCGITGVSATGDVPANFAGGGTPAGITFIQDENYRTFPTTCATCTATEEGVAPGLKPYTQHETVFGVDHQVSQNWAFEARWDRRRLDHVIEDAALYNPSIGETFVIVNPGQGINSTFDGFWNFLYGSPSGCVPQGQTATPPAANCPGPPPLAARSYDGVEFRLTKTPTHHWATMISYTWSNFRGNYSGLTNTDMWDGGGGRNAPNNSRAFDEPFFYYDYQGKFNNGPLATDRPNTFKGYAYYELPWLHKFVTNVGIFEDFLQGSPLSSFVDMGNSFAPDTGAYGVPNAEGGAFPTSVVPRGYFLPISQDSSGNITVGDPYQRRTPWFTQSDFQLTQTYKISENKTLSYSLTVPNVFNQHAITAYWEGIDTDYYPQFLAPPSAACGAQNAAASIPGSACNQSVNGYQFYAAAMSPYNYKAMLNSAGGVTGSSGAMTINSIYGQPLYRQLTRNLYMAVKFTF